MISTTTFTFENHKTCSAPISYRLQQLANIPSNAVAQMDGKNESDVGDNPTAVKAPKCKVWRRMTLSTINLDL